MASRTIAKRGRRGDGEQARKPPGKYGQRARLEKFAREYLIDLHAGNAALRAGCPAASASVQGSRMLQHPWVRAQVVRAMANVGRKTELSIERVCLELRCILDLDPLDIHDETGRLRPLAEWPEAARRALASITYNDLGGIESIKMHSKIEAANLLLKRLGAFVEQIEIKRSYTDILAGAEKLLAAPVVTVDADTPLAVAAPDDS